MGVPDPTKELVNKKGIRLDGRKTLYCALGDWLPVGCGLLLLGYLAATAVVVWRRTKERLGGTKVK